ncbi:MAG: LarC family nickel insertion protein [Dehalococcoidia bacterium]|nr:LarC family nickel insertion protein [Dehalococcoidia bacterium]
MTRSAGARVAVFDCFSGIAGDMTLATLLDAGASLEAVSTGLAGLGLPPFQIDHRQVTRGGLRATLLTLDVGEERTFQPDEMTARIRAATLPERVRERAFAAVNWLARGEAEAHAEPSARLHEAGGVDALIDIVGSMVALEDLKVVTAFCPVVTVGAGTIARTAHGPIPAAPGPAAAAILQAAGFPMRFVAASHELVTPTGAAILAAVAHPGPATVTPLAHGAGAGTADPSDRPNALRVFIGTLAARHSTLRPLVQLEANVDDMSPALLAHARDRLLEEGALDAWLEPIGMKKGRAATKLAALALPEDENRLAGLFLAETTTLGVRVTDYRRHEAARVAGVFRSSLGEVRTKTASVGGSHRTTVEFEDVRRLAHERGLSALEVQRWLERELHDAERDRP